MVGVCWMISQQDRGSSSTVMMGSHLKVSWYSFVRTMEAGMRLFHSVHQVQLPVWVSWVESDVTCVC